MNKPVKFFFGFDLTCAHNQVVKIFDDARSGALFGENFSETKNIVACLSEDNTMAHDQGCYWIC